MGQILSRQLRTFCIDLDERIEQAAGKTIREIFADGGEASFRDWETQCLRTVAEQPPPASPSRCPVVSLGGGAILREQNRQLIAHSGVCVWLTARPETIARRIGGDATTAQRRPALTDLSPTEEIAAVLRQRETLYRQAADFAIDTEDKSPQQIAQEVLDWLAQR